MGIGLEEDARDGLVGRFMLSSFPLKAINERQLDFSGA